VNDELEGAATEAECEHSTGGNESPRNLSVRKSIT
jgi:hypothetical protein